MAGRRELRFDGLGAVMPEVRRLLGGYEAAGTWSLGQIARHLATSILLTARADGTADRGRPPSPRWADRRRKFFEAGRFPEGVVIPLPILVPPPGLDDRAEAEALAAAIEEFEASESPPPYHPLLGPLSKADWAAFHALHCAHHLAFALPEPAASPTGGPTP